MPQTKNLTLITDLPIGEGKDFTEDGLGFDVYGEVLGRAILSNPGPFTIGVFGEWGTGKTSLLKMIERYIMLQDEENIIPVWFNAWRYEKDDHPIIPLIRQIIHAVENQRGFLEDLGQSGKSLVRALRAIIYGLSARSKLTIPGFAEIQTDFSPKQMIDREEQLKSDAVIEKSLYYEAFETLSSIKLGKKKRIVVIIDDLDRCFPDNAIKLLESIKLILSQEGFIFVLGISRKVIEGYLQNRYEKEYGIEKFNGRSYLDKIIQLVFHIPSHVGRLNSFSTKLLSKLSDENKNVLKEIIEILGVACKNNPRVMVRFINTLLVDQAVNKALADRNEFEEIGIGFFAITRSLQLNWRDVFEILMKSDNLCQTVNSWNNMQEIHIPKEHRNLELDFIKKELTSDQNLRDLLFSSIGRTWLIESELRRATVEFLLSKRFDISLASYNRDDIAQTVVETEAIILKIKQTTPMDREKLVNLRNELIELAEQAKIINDQALYNRITRDVEELGNFLGHWVN